jgi:hypothetical protein
LIVGDGIPKSHELQLEGQFEEIMLEFSKSILCPWPTYQQCP